MVFSRTSLLPEQFARKVPCNFVYCLSVHCPALNTLRIPTPFRLARLLLSASCRCSLSQDYNAQTLSALSIVLCWSVHELREPMSASHPHAYKFLLHPSWNLTSFFPSYPHHLPSFTGGGGGQSSLYAFPLRFSTPSHIWGMFIYGPSTSPTTLAVYGMSEM